MNIQHSSRSDQWMTPMHIVEMARKVLGTIDLDPASSAVANRRVQATEYHSVQTDGLYQPWYGSVFCNPPGGRIGRDSKTAMFWKRMVTQPIVQGIFMGFSLECLQSTQGKGVRSALEFPLCVPSKRVRFELPEPNVHRNAPSHSNVIVYVPGEVDNTDLFIEVFSALGACKR
jgi:hypothetical protein